MIAGKMFQNLSRKTGIKAEALEKDYVMNLILDAIAHCPQTRESFFFKGGYCVHKCFSAHTFTPKTRGVDDYFLAGRFSSDIDLTVRPDTMNEGKLTAAFEELKAYLVARHGLVINQFSFPIHENKKQKVGGHFKRNCRGGIHFKGPLYNAKFNPPSLKFDLTADESVVFQPYRRSICHPYKEGEDLVADTYTLRDVFAEKFRALFERYSGRDMFDVLFLAEHPDMKDPQRQLGIGYAIIEKLRVKNIPLAVVDGNFPIDVKNKDLVKPEEEFKKAWEGAMAREKGEDLPPFKTAWSHLLKAVKMGQACVKRAQKQLVAYQSKHPGMSLTEALQHLDAKVEQDIVRRRPMRQNDGR